MESEVKSERVTRAALQRAELGDPRLDHREGQRTDVLGLGAAMAVLVVLALLSPVVRAPADRSLVAPLGLSKASPPRHDGPRS